MNAGYFVLRCGDLVRKLLHCCVCVAEHNDLTTFDLLELLVQLEEHLSLVLRLLHWHVVLADSFERHFLFLHDNASCILNEILGDFNHVCWECGREKGDLNVAVEMSENGTNLLLVSLSLKEMIGLIDYKQSEVLCTECTPFEHVEDSTGCPDYNVNVVVSESVSIFFARSTTYAYSNIDVNLFANRANNVSNLFRKFTSWGKNYRLGAPQCCIDTLQEPNAKSTSLSGS